MPVSEYSGEFTKLIVNLSGLSREPTSLSLLTLCSPRDVQPFSVSVWTTVEEEELSWSAH